MWATRDYRRLLNLQLLIDQALKQEKLTPLDLEKLTRSLVTIIDTKRVLRMQPKPRDLDTTLAPTKLARIPMRTIEDAPKESLSSPDTPHGTTPERGQGDRA